MVGPLGAAMVSKLPFTIPAAGLQLPAVSQSSVPLHTLPSGQTVFAGLAASAGQLAELPLQFSAMSHGPTAARQTVAELANVSVGQAAALPVQFSAISHPPEAAVRQTVVAGAKTSFGHVAEVPVQFSATSQPPGAAARQTVPALPAGC